MQNTGRFVEACEGLKRSIPPLMLKAENLPKWQSEKASSNAGLFLSIYQYPTTDPNVGHIISDFYLDFDNEESPDKARKEAVATIKKLIEEYKISESSIAIAFSGCKGVSVTISHQVFNTEPSENLPAILKSIAKEPKPVYTSKRSTPEFTTDVAYGASSTQSTTRLDCTRYRLH